MLNKLTIRWRLTILSAFLLTICCVGLTFILNFSAFKLVDQLDVTITTIPSTDNNIIQSGEKMEQIFVPPTYSQEATEAKKGFSSQSVLYMLLFICSGSALTYYISGKALKPLEALSSQVKNLTVHNLDASLEVPKANDEIQELAKSFNDMSDKLNEAFLQQKRFSASAAHELRTPLAVLQTKIDVFNKTKNNTAEEYDELIAVFEKQVSRLRKLVGDVLDMTNMEDTNEKSDICLNDVFVDIISELSGIANEKNISLQLNCDDTEIVGNVDLIYHAFYNIIENGIKYNTDDGYVKIDVENMNENGVKVLISDSGIGISSDVKNNIFEPFYRVDKSRSREMGGAGLGLCIVDNIIKKHSGTIKVYDNISAGTCFEIVLE